MKKIFVTRKLLKENEKKLESIFQVILSKDDKIYSSQEIIDGSKDCDGILSSVTDKIDSTENKKRFEHKSFLKGLERRQQTLLLVAQYIIEAQTGFLNGIAGKKAISNEEIAEKKLHNFLENIRNFKPDHAKQIDQILLDEERHAKYSLAFAKKK